MILFLYLSDGLSTGSTMYLHVPDQMEQQKSVSCICNHSNMYIT